MVSYKCLLCRGSSRDFYDNQLSLHISADHSNPQLFHCHKCDFRTLTRSQLHSHFVETGHGDQSTSFVPVECPPTLSHSIIELVNFCQKHLSPGWCEWDQIFKLMNAAVIALQNVRIDRLSMVTKSDTSESSIPKKSSNVGIWIPLEYSANSSVKAGSTANVIKVEPKPVEISANKPDNQSAQIPLDTKPICKPNVGLRRNDQSRESKSAQSTSQQPKPTGTVATTTGHKCHQCGEIFPRRNFLSRKSFGFLCHKCDGDSSPLPKLKQSQNAHNSVAVKCDTMDKCLTTDSPANSVQKKPISMSYEGQYKEHLKKELANGRIVWTCTKCSEKFGYQLAGTRHILKCGEQRSHSLTCQDHKSTKQSGKSKSTQLVDFSLIQIPNTQVVPDVFANNTITVGSSSSGSAKASEPQRQLQVDETINLIDFQDSKATRVVLSPSILVETRKNLKVKRKSIAVVTNKTQNDEIPAKQTARSARRNAVSMPYTGIYKNELRKELVNGRKIIWTCMHVRCGNSYDCQSVAVTHLRSHRPPEFECRICGRRFTYAHQHKHHESVCYERNSKKAGRKSKSHEYARPDRLRLHKKLNHRSKAQVVRETKDEESVSYEDESDVDDGVEDESDIQNVSEEVTDGSLVAKVAKPTQKRKAIESDSESEEIQPKKKVAEEVKKPKVADHKDQLEMLDDIDVKKTERSESPSVADDSDDSDDSDFGTSAKGKQKKSAATKKSPVKPRGKQAAKAKSSTANIPGVQMESDQIKIDVNGNKLADRPNDEIWKEHAYCHRNVRFPCDQCEHTFAQAGGLQVHKRLAHSLVPVVNEFKCEFPHCGKQFPLKGRLKQHQKVHSKDVSEYVSCEVCEKKFVDKHRLAQHMEIHSGITYYCDECPSTFKQKMNLTTHKKLHSD